VRGAGLMAWALAAHCEAAPRGWARESGLTPQYLLRSGPYRLSRNPMYAGEAVVWLGWAGRCFTAGRLSGRGWPSGAAAFAGIVRWEEQRLLGRFGGDYRTYLTEVPRWVPGAGKDPLPVHRPAGPYPALLASRRWDAKVLDGGTRVTPFRPRRVIGCRF
jgi:hypothetical protein